MVAPLSGKTAKLDVAKSVAVPFGNVIPTLSRVIQYRSSFGTATMGTFCKAPVYFMVSMPPKITEPAHEALSIRYLVQDRIR
jgi:hypothetical protein